METLKFASGFGATEFDSVAVVIFFNDDFLVSLWN